MPELPEVITIRNDLRKEVLGKRIKSVKKAKGYNFDSNVLKTLVGQEITEVTNVAKLLLLGISSGNYIAVHLNMTGLLLFNAEDPYIKITLELDSGDKLHYSSVRMFGFFDVWPVSKANEYKNYSGQTALESNLTKEDFAEKIGSRKKPIKTALLDQKIISGIGNIYANDALFMAKIHPKRNASILSQEELFALFEALQVILNEGIEHRGSTIDRYRDLYGKPGWHQDFFRVYGKRGGQPCPNCKNPLTYEKMQGRPTFYCEICQPIDTRPKLL